MFKKILTVAVGIFAMNLQATQPPTPGYKPGFSIVTNETTPVNQEYWNFVTELSLINCESTTDSSMISSPPPLAGLDGNLFEYNMLHRLHAGCVEYNEISWPVEEGIMSDSLSMYDLIDHISQDESSYLDEPKSSE